MLVLGYYHYHYERNETNIFRTTRFFRILYQIKTGILFNRNQYFLTTMHSIVMLCSMLIQDIIFWYYFPETVNMLKYESFYKTVFVEFLICQVKKWIRLNVNQSASVDISVHGVITYSMLVYFINVLSRDRNKTKSLSSHFRAKNIFGKYFTKIWKVICLRINLFGQHCTA